MVPPRVPRACRQPVSKKLGRILGKSKIFDCEVPAGQIGAESGSLNAGISIEYGPLLVNAPISDLGD